MPRNTTFLWKRTACSQFSFVSLMVSGVVILVLTHGFNALADGFSDRLVRFDGKLTRGKLDSNNNLTFFGWAKWRDAVIIKFSPFVRANFSLAPFIETEVGGVLGKYTITINLFRKRRGGTYQNLRIKILDRENGEVGVKGVVSPINSGWIIGIVTEQKPFAITVSYSSEKGLDIMPLP